MGYALFNAANSPAPRCAYAKVTVNGTSLGIYSHVETVRKPFLKRAFGNDSGTLYEGPYVDFYPGWEGSFEHKSGKDKPGRKKIKQLIKILENEDENTDQAIGELVDLDSFYTFWAMEGLLGLGDGYSGFSNNFFIYLNPDTNKFHFFPWGADSGFYWSDKGSSSDDDLTEFEDDLNFVQTQGLIAHRLYQLESSRERYAKTIMGIIEKHWHEDELLAEINRIEVMLKPHLVQSQIYGNGKKQKSENVFTSSLDKTRKFIRQRELDITQEIANGMPESKKSYPLPWREPLTIAPKKYRTFALGCTIGGCVGCITGWTSFNLAKELASWIIGLF